MNRNSGRGAKLEMRWHSIIAESQPKVQCPQLLMNWISTASLHSRMSN